MRGLTIHMPGSTIHGATLAGNSLVGDVLRDKDAITAITAAVDEMQSPPLQLPEAVSEGDGALCARQGSVVRS